ncbi:hypothetical protein TNCV_2758551 [Trichonephila clavipes]|nr:hypothetical protein TNCV_2758551 [Trichonephila clavipes]
MPRSGGQSEVRPPVFNSPSKFGTHLSTHCRAQDISLPESHKHTLNVLIAALHQLCLSTVATHLEVILPSPSRSDVCNDVNGTKRDSVLGSAEITTILGPKWNSRVARRRERTISHTRRRLRK